MQPEMGRSFKAAQNLYREARSREGVGGEAARAGSGVQELSPLVLQMVEGGQFRI